MWRNCFILNSHNKLTSSLIFMLIDTIKKYTMYTSIFNSSATLNFYVNSDWIIFGIVEQFLH